MKYEDHYNTTEQGKSKYVEMLGGRRKTAQLNELGLQCVVSDYALIHWYAQAFKLDVNNLP